MGDLVAKKKLCHPCFNLHSHGCSIFAVHYIVVSKSLAFKDIESWNVVAYNINAHQCSDVLFFVWCQIVYKVYSFLCPYYTILSILCLCHTLIAIPYIVWRISIFLVQFVKVVVEVVYLLCTQYFFL